MEKILNSYLPRIQANTYWIEKLLSKGENNKWIVINKLANIGYLAN